MRQMRRDTTWVGLSPCRSVSKQKPDCNKNLPLHHFSSRFRSVTIQVTYVSSLQGDLRLQTVQLTEAQGSLRSSRQGSSHVPPRLPWNRSERTKSLFLFFATPSRRHLHGNSLVNMKFSTRDTLLQMYPPDIWHAPKETSEYKGALFFFFWELDEAETDLRRTLVGIFCTGTSWVQWRISHGKTYFFLWHILSPVFRQIIPHQVVNVIENVLVLPLPHTNRQQQRNTLQHLHLSMGEPLGYKVRYASHLRVLSAERL